jgi:hypothetical protein
MLALSLAYFSALKMEMMMMMMPKARILQPERYRSGQEPSSMEPLEINPVIVGHNQAMSM